FPGTQVTIGPSIENGFYYDFHREAGFAPEELEQIEKAMTKIAQDDLPFVREEVSRDEALALFDKMGEKFKCELVDAIPDGDAISLYRHGDWVDLCRGPHVPSTGALKAFKLTHVSGAYWRGDEKNPMLARIYGTAFWDNKSLKKHLAQIEEAKKRDHRKLGRELDLFWFHPLAPAMPFFQPKGTLVYNLLVDFVRGYYARLGFDEVITPQIVDAELYHRSGHYANYKENMFFSQIDEREFGVKPMNCPGHALMYGIEKHSYRDLPIRFADFGRLHRYERSGVTAGLTRVRSFSQDDAHIFCRENQIAEELASQVAMIRDIYETFDFKVRVGFSTRPEKSMGKEDGLSDEERLEWDAIWNHAESTLEEALKSSTLEYRFNHGDGAFYGPKIDFQVCDALGRWHQLGTIQLDFSMPRRFDLSYINAEGEKDRPVMIHRAALGSLERFMGILIEHCAGDFPVWLAPVQMRILTINDALKPYAETLKKTFENKGLRVEIDDRSEKLGFKIRDAEVKKIPMVIVVGEREEENNEVSLRFRKKDNRGNMALDQAITLVLQAAAAPKNEV
ncbi:MAG: threonine--tRNA ligase, partial [Myxococcota bacterium]|nr:threonine--tRNA ligase [Myxococcota bacterium]